MILTESDAGESDVEGLFIPSNDLEIKTELYRFWKSLSPPTKECDIVGKWFAAIYLDSKGKPLLNIGKATMRFLDDDPDEGGKCTSLQLDCLKPHIGNSLTMEEYPEDQHDLHNFEIHNIFAGPLQMNPYRNRT